jgi:carboxypeptidase family protein
MRSSVGLAAFLLIGALGVPLGAQQLSGTVRDSTSRQPIPGAVLMLLDGSGTVIGRNITNERGEYRVALSSGMRRVRVVRIGFRPAEVLIPVAAGGMTELNIGMRALPTLLEPVRVSAGAHCPRRSDEATTFALLEQVRAGLLAIVVAR